MRILHNSRLVTLSIANIPIYSFNMAMKTQSSLQFVQSAVSIFHRTLLILHDIMCKILISETVLHEHLPLWSQRGSVYENVVTVLC
jgi:hypothetical protein